MKKLSILSLTVLLGAAVACADNQQAKQPADQQPANQQQNTTMTKTQSANFLYSADLPWQTPVQGLKRQILGYNSHLMLVRIDFEPGCDGGGTHSHYHTQSTIVTAGVFEVTIGGVTKTLKAGDGFLVDPDVPHMAKCIEAGTLVDSFSPVRADFIGK
ncbi:MAG: cupin domain-containing protein [Rikenellaceae bacterium]|jgi:quercetin dioxygenase-like cupin family protein|nr:cupin domain-containing protein [Rikenellaceae bacterium]